MCKLDLSNDKVIAVIAKAKDADDEISALTSDINWNKMHISALNRKLSAKKRISQPLLVWIRDSQPEAFEALCGVIGVSSAVLLEELKEGTLSKEAELILGHLTHIEQQATEALELEVLNAKLREPNASAANACMEKNLKKLMDSKPF